MTSHQINLTLTSSSGLVSISGYDNETGNTELATTNLGFPAGSTNAAFTLTFTTANLQDVFLWSDKGGTITTNGTNVADVQTISITGTPTGGSFPVAFNGQVTELAFNESATNAQTALQGLSTIGASNITCSGGPLPGTPIVCTFAAARAPGFQPLMTTYSGSLTGGSSPTVAITHTTPGEPTNTIILQPGVPLMWGVSTGYGSNPFGNGNVTQAFFTCTPSSRLSYRLLSL